MPCSKLYQADELSDMPQDRSCGGAEQYRRLHQVGGVRIVIVAFLRGGTRSFDLRVMIDGHNRACRLTTEWSRRAIVWRALVIEAHSSFGDVTLSMHNP